MKINPVPKTVAAAVAVFGFILSAGADSYLNTFDTPFNYVANGIIGDSFWDGVYLRFGDVPGANAGGYGNGSTLQADTTFYPGYLNLRSVGGDWSGAGNDGFFIYKVVSGDFDVSVENHPYDLSGGLAFDNRAYHFAGLMIRAYHTNNSGAPYSTTLPTDAENFVLLWRFNEFNIDTQIRISTNGANLEYTVTSGMDTNTVRFYRIVRQNETNFMFYVKTNATDEWYQIMGAPTVNGVYRRPDWAGVTLQVGIAQAPFATAPRDAVFDNFAISGPNVVVPSTLPPAPSNVQVTDVNSNSVRITWTSNGGDGSLVVIRENGPLIANPVQGVTYTGNQDFRAAPGLSAANSRIVYVGSGTDIVVTGLGGSNNTYNAAVYSYVNTPSGPVYNTANPATATFIGPGRVASVSFTLTPTQVPRGGVAIPTVIATYNSGDSYDVSGDPASVWESSDPGVILPGYGVLTALGTGTAQVVVTYAGIRGTNTVTVVEPAFMDEFDKPHDYVAQGVVGSLWDGVYLNAGDVPFQIAANLGPQPGRTTNANANISSNGVLTVTSWQTGWEGHENDGFFLYKVVPGDFQAMVNIAGFQVAAWQFVGLQARLFGTVAGTDGPGGTAASPHNWGRESHVNLWRFDQFGITTSARRMLNGATTVENHVDGMAAPYLLLVRINGTNFNYFKRMNPTDPWQPSPASVAAVRLLAQATPGRPMQVGVATATYDSGTAWRTAWIDSFMLHADGLNVGSPPAGSPTGFTNWINLPAGTMTLRWTNAPDSVGSIVVMRAGGPVNASPAQGVTYTASSLFGQGSNLGSSNYVVYVGSGNTVTVSGLTPGVTYYAAIFSYSTNALGQPVYNKQTTAPMLSAFVGALQDIALRVSGRNQIPLGGVGIARVTALYGGGATADVTSSATLDCNNPSVILITNNNLNAVGLGTAIVTAVYGSKTNSVLVTVRNPTHVDNFNVSHNYLLSGTAGTIWDGVYFGAPANHPNNSIPYGSYGAGLGQTFVCDANITSNGCLSVQTTHTDWEWADNDGFFLFRYAPGDFQVRVHITTMDTLQWPPQAYTTCGLLARQSGPAGAPSGGALGTNENWVSWTRFDQFNIATYARNTTADGNTIRLTTTPLAENTNYWLLLVKDGANFHFFEKANPEDLWIERFAGSIVRPDLVGAMQVGIIQATFSANIVMSQFDGLMLDAAVPTLQAIPDGNNVVLSWAAVPGVVLKQTASLTQPNWQTVGGTPIFTNGLYQLTIPMTNATAFFRLFY